VARKGLGEVMGVRRVSGTILPAYLGFEERKRGGRLGASDEGIGFETGLLLNYSVHCNLPLSCKERDIADFPPNVTSKSILNLTWRKHN